MTIILYINQILYLLFTTAYTGHRIWSNLIYLRALRAQTRINGLLVLFLTGEAYGDRINSWSSDEAWYSLDVRKEFKINMDQWSRAWEGERTVPCTIAHLRSHTHTQVRRQFWRITPVIHVSVWGRCLSDTWEGLTEFIIHLDTETSQYQLSAARHV